MRHAQNTNTTHGNVDACDVGLSELGQEQARGVKGDYDIVVMSPMLRCWQTLEHSQLSYKEIITMEEAREMKRHHFCDYKQGEEVFPETDDEMFARMEILWKKLREITVGDKRVLYLGHGKVVFYLTSLIHGRNKENGLRMKDAQIVEYDI